MTKREFDSSTKINYGTFLGRRVDYRINERKADYYGVDKLSQRAAWRRRNPELATLALGSPMRAPVEWRLMGRFPRLPLTHEELAARG